MDLVIDRFPFYLIFLLDFLLNVQLCLNMLFFDQFDHFLYIYEKYFSVYISYFPEINYVEFLYEVVIRQDSPAV